MLDEPKGTAETFGYATAGWTDAPVVGEFIRHAAPLLGIEINNPDGSVPSEYVDLIQKERRLASF